jgi:leucyl-tRNA synthetase
VAEPLVLMTAPFAPHLAEELWARLGHDGSLTYQAFPVAEDRWLKADAVVYPVQVNGKVRGRVEVPADADPAAVEAAALADEKVAGFLAGRTPRKVIVVPGRTVSVVV